MTKLHLTVCFRCAKTIIANAQWRAPDMLWTDWAEEGKVNRPLSWTTELINDNAAIICRNNAPLFRIALKLIEDGKLPEILGRDLARPLLKIMKNLGKEKTPKLLALDALKDWKNVQIKRARKGAVGGINDYYSCIHIMIDRTKNLGDAIAYLEHLLNREGRIYLMTGHKSKGLEFDEVFFLDAFLCRKEQDQDANIKYVIETRAKKVLTYINSATLEGFEDDENDE